MSQDLRKKTKEYGTIYISNGAGEKCFNLDSEQIEIFCSIIFGYTERIARAEYTKKL